MSEINMIGVNLIVPGPWSRSSFHKIELVKSICDTISDDNGLQNIRPLTVKPLNDGHYMLIDGEARLNAVKNAGNFEDVPCIVIDITDYDALLQFANNNNQHHLSPLQIGLLGVLLEDGIGGRTENGDPNRSPKGELARITGTDRANLTKYIRAARVYIVVRDLLDNTDKIILNKKTEQLSQLTSIPNDCLLSFVKKIIKGANGKTITKGTNLIDTVFDLDDYQYCLDRVITLDKLVEMNLEDATGAMAVKPMFEQVVKTKNELLNAGRHDELEQFESWLHDNAIKKDRLNIREVRSKCLELQSGSIDPGDIIVNDDAIIFIDTIPDNSIGGCFMDFPYGVEYQDIQLDGIAIEGDTKEESTELHEVISLKLYNKMCDNSYVVVWFAPSRCDVIKPIFDRANFKFQQYFTWQKTGHTQTLLPQPLNQQEFAMIFTKGTGAMWLTPTPNFFVCATPDPKQHPCEKPLQLCDRIVQSIMAPGQTLLDLSFGSGNALKAGRRHGCRLIGCEKDIRHYTNGFNNIYMDDEEQVA